MREDLITLIKKIRALRKLTRDTGFRTTRSQNELLAKLNADDLAAVVLGLDSDVYDEPKIAPKGESND